MTRSTKSTLTIAIAAVICVCVFARHAGATPPPSLVNYQGVLRNSSGAPLSGSYNVILRLHDALTAGNEILVDRHTSLDGGQITISGGLFNILIGSGSILDGAGPGIYTDLRTVFKDHTNVYLSVQIEGETLAPRTQVFASPYALGGPRGVIYTRWGKNSCPAGSSLLYNGYPASGFYTSPGGTTSVFCLTSAPTWDEFNDANASAAALYGTEYQTGGSGIPSLAALNDEDAVCSVCLQPDADITFMYAGSQVCPTGWHTEYTGYIVANWSENVAPKEGVCMDRAPDVRVGGTANANGNLFYTTEANCGSLPCPPYVANREVTCSVCTR